MAEIVIPIPGQRYKHYKGGTYEIIGMTTHPETKEPWVIYKSVNYFSLHIKSLKEWDSPVPKEKAKEFGRNSGIRFWSI